MKREADTAAVLSLPTEEVELALAHIEHSPAFRNSPRHRTLLRHLVSRALADEYAELKETVIAVEVFGRPAASFDPKADSIVRVEARRLRARLADYYRADGRNSPIRIALPVGSYVPLIVTREPALRGEAATRRARDLVEHGEHFLRQALTQQTLGQALDRFDAALRESPAYAPALVGMGRAWMNLATGWYAEPAVASAHALEALHLALELEPEHAVAHVLLGAVQHQFERNWPAAQRSFRRAVALGPQQAFVHSAYGAHLMMRGAHAEAEQELLLARRLDPQYINTRIHMTNLRIAQGRLPDAEAEIESMRDIAPATMPILTMRALIAMFRRDAEAAVGLYQQACEVAPDYAGCFIALAGAHAAAGRTEQADALMSETLQRFDPQRLSPYVLAVFATRRGRSDEAFALLARAVQQRDPNAIQIGIDASFEGLHADPRWPALKALVAQPAPLP